MTKITGFSMVEVAMLGQQQFFIDTSLSKTLKICTNL